MHVQPLIYPRSYYWIVVFKIWSEGGFPITRWIKIHSLSPETEGQHTADARQKLCLAQVYLADVPILCLIAFTTPCL